MKGLPSALALGAVVGASLACARKAGPNPGESTLWVIVAPGTSSQGCEGAAVLVDQVADSFGEGLGIGWSVDASGGSARLLDCEDGMDVSLATCSPTGVPGEVAGDGITWVLPQTIVEEGGCAVTMVETVQVTDGGGEGTLAADVAFAVEGGAGCAFTVDGEAVEPDGCAVSVEADLELVEWEKTL